MSTPKPSPELVQAFWAHMSARYNTKIVDKASACEMQIAAWFLEKIGVLDAERFLSRYTTTIGTPHLHSFRDRGHKIWPRSLEPARHLRPRTPTRRAAARELLGSLHGALSREPRGESRL